MEPATQWNVLDHLTADRFSTLHPEIAQKIKESAPEHFGNRVTHRSGASQHVCGVLDGRWINRRATGRPQLSHWRNNGNVACGAANLPG